nr:MAG TPA: IrrE N-terminal-like domain [Caudoviricetes sp.]DAM53927.1 MAG TPA: IrrE N-terminal-like domain [Caudoviricetes sp.]
MDKIKILGQTYNIIEKDMKNEEVIFGEIEYLTNTIIINKEMQEEKKKITLLHEVLHAIFSQLRLDEKINESENLISSLAESLYMFLNENKNFISF